VLPPVHVLRYAVALEQMRALIGDALGPVAAEGLVGKGDRELLAVRIFHHAGELARLSALVGGLLCARLAQERFGQLDRAVGETHGSCGRGVRVSSWRAGGSSSSHRRGPREVTSAGRRNAGRASPS